MNTPTSFTDRRRCIMKLEDWLRDAPADALKELAGRVPEIHAASKPKVIEYILGDRWSRENALESMRIEAEAHERMRTYDASPSELWAKRFTLPW